MRILAAALSLACAARTTDIAARTTDIAAAASAPRVLGGADTISLAFAVLLHAQQMLPQIVVGVVALFPAGTTRRRETPTRREPVR